MITPHNPISLDQLGKIKCIQPTDAGAYWQGIPHGRLVDILLEQISERGWQIGNLQLEVGNEGMDFVGVVEVFEIASPFSVGWTTSNSRNRRLRFYSGLVVDGVGIALQELTVRKHVQGFNLTDELAMVLDDFLAACNRVPRIHRRLSERVLDRAEYHDLLLTAGRMHLMPWSRLGRVDGLCGPGAHTSWEVLIAFARVAAMNPAIRQMDQVCQFHRMLPTAVVTGPAPTVAISAIEPSTSVAT